MFKALHFFRHHLRVWFFYSILFTSFRLFCAMLLPAGLFNHIHWPLNQQTNHVDDWAKRRFSFILEGNAGLWEATSGRCDPYPLMAPLLIPQAVRPAFFLVVFSKEIVCGSKSNGTYISWLVFRGNYVVDA